MENLQRKRLKIHQPARKRLKVRHRPFLPQWSGSVQKYALAYATRQLWKVESSMTLDDLLQESWIVFRQCADRYSGKIDNPRWFMALFKVALARHVIDLAAKDTRSRTIPTWQTFEDAAEAQHDVPGDLENDGYLLTLIRQAPAGLKFLFETALNAPGEVADAVGEDLRNLFDSKRIENYARNYLLRV